MTNKKQTGNKQGPGPTDRPTAEDIIEMLLVIYAEDMLENDYGPWNEVFYFLFSRENKLVRNFFKKLGRAGCSFEEFFEKSRETPGSGIEAFSNWLNEGHFDPMVPYSLEYLRVLEDPVDNSE